MRKNNVHCVFRDKSYFFHIVPRVHSIECQLYIHGDAKRHTTIGYFDTDTLQWCPTGKEHEWSWPKMIAETLFRHRYRVMQSVHRLLYRRLLIEYIGKQEVFNNG